MAEFAKEMVAVSIEDELKDSYLDYAMSVIVGRALPDVRDGLKPVHRRVLFAMHELHNDWNKAYKKSARIVGDVIGKYHPHGDTAVYDTIVRMAQPFSMRYVLVDGQGNFGSIDGDAPAAMRYTEIRMSRLAHDLLSDLDKETVAFVPNYDGTEMIPDVLPTRVPNLLINGSSGIAVGMATNIPPHHLGEVIDACISLIDSPELSVDDLMQYIPGPDFPTAGIINGRAGIVEAYRTGRGSIIMRARTEVEEIKNSQKEAIIVTELPYQVNKARLLERIAELVKDKKIEGISGLRDESDKDGMRIVIELRKNESPEIILNNLFAHTAMQTSFGVNMMALEGGQPRLLNLKQVLEAFLYHRREVVTRRTAYELNQAQDRAHLLEGLSIALANIDSMIALIKSSKTPAEAKERLIQEKWQPGPVTSLLERAKAQTGLLKKLDARYGLVEGKYCLSPEQAQAILDLKLHRLTALEQESIATEYQDILKLMEELALILRESKRLMQIIREELLAEKQQFADKRLTEIIETQEDLTTEDLIADEPMVVTLSHEGYVKRQSTDVYQSQRRGGRGKTATDIKEEDVIERALVASTHDTLLCFSDYGKVYWLKVYQLPEAGRNARGKPIINLLPLASDERINAVLPIRDFTATQFIFMATANGTVKKVALEQFSRPRTSGIIAVDLVPGDRLVAVDLTSGQDDLMIFSDSGKVIRFNESNVRAMGRVACGVRGIKLPANQKVIAALVVKNGGAILTATENGYGKRTAVDEYRVIGRGGQGVVSIQVTERNGKVVSALQVVDTDEVMLVTDGGTLVRIPVGDISVIGRNTQGVRLIQLNTGEKLKSITRVAE